jgi:hypothetical protein
MTGKRQNGSWAARNAGRAGARVILARCLASGVDVPYPLAAQLRAALPIMTSAIDSAAVFAEKIAQAPTIVAIDDSTWLDEPSSRWLEGVVPIPPQPF